MARRKEPDNLTYFDLDPNKDHMKQIKEILKQHSELCLCTYHFANHLFSAVKDMKLFKNKRHIVAVFGNIKNCVLINRGDGIRWGIAVN